MRTLRVALAQINATVGDLDGNTRRIVDQVHRARSLDVDLVAFPELAITGYPPEDLLFKSRFIQDNVEKMRQVVEASRGIAVVVGFVDADADIYNAAAIAYDGKLVDVYHKMHLPNYGVFDEERYFKSGSRCPVYVLHGTRIGVNVCEDIWLPTGPTVVQRSAGAEVIVNINGSPFHVGKRESKERMLATRAVDSEVFVAYVNLVGGQDELVFDGASVVLDPDGAVIARGAQFEEDLLVVDLDVEAVLGSRLRESRRREQRSSVLQGIGETSLLEIAAEPSGPPTPRTPPPRREERTLDPMGEVYAALVLGTRDYVEKCGFRRVLVAMSGGIDSSLVAAVAVDALGPGNVLGVAMPSRFSSEGSLLDAEALTEALGMELKTIPIEDAFSTYLDTLGPHFDDIEWGVAEENLQSRIRGNLIMALANKFGWLVLTTGNKSEMATGYATIYGDMAGGFAVIKDVPKMMVYRLAEYRNGMDGRDIIPRSVIEKPPSAELRPDQKDEDSLPPYSTLDLILEAYVEEDKSFEEIVGMGFEQAVVKLVIGLVDRSEYKRRQAPPGIKITPRNFGRDRRMPIANRYQPF